MGLGDAFASDDSRAADATWPHKFSGD